MAKRSSKPRDTNSLAAAIVAQSVDPDDHGKDPYEGKDPAAVESGRKGGLKGGKARADALTGAERARIASAAAKTRWGTSSKS